MDINEIEHTLNKVKQIDLESFKNYLNWYIAKHNWKNESKEKLDIHLMTVYNHIFNLAIFTKNNLLFDDKTGFVLNTTQPKVFEGNNEYLTQKQVAKLLSVQPATVQNWRANKGLKSYRIGKNVVIIYKKDLFEFFSNFEDKRHTKTIQDSKYFNKM